MATERETQPPKMWVSNGDRNNVVVLTRDKLYAATVKKIGLAAIDLGLEEGRAAEALLPAKAWKAPLDTITRIQVKQVRSKSMFEEWMNKDVTVSYQDGRKERKLKIALASESMRDEVVQALIDRLGRWPFTETPVPGWLILARYLYIVAIFSLLTAFLCWLELTGQWHTAGGRGALNNYFETFGVWGIFVPGLAFCLTALMMGVWQLQAPPIVVTYEPRKERI